MDYIMRSIPVFMQQVSEWTVTLLPASVVVVLSDKLYGNCIIAENFHLYINIYSYMLYI